MKQGRTLQDVTSWVQWADQDYVAARMLFFSGTPFVWIPAVVVAQQAIEKYFKAILVSLGERVDLGLIWGHDLEQLAKECAKASLEKEKMRMHFSPDFTNALRLFKNYFEEVRYPTKLEKVQELGFEALRLLDNIVAQLRPSIRFDGSGIPPKFVDLYPETSEPFAKFVKAAQKENKYWGEF